MSPSRHRLSVFNTLIVLQEILEKRSEMMNEYKRFKEQAAEEWESMKYRRMELRGGKQGKKNQFRNLSMIYI